MKLLSVAIPCYNSEAYMRNCIHSLLAGGEEVEIIIVDDVLTSGQSMADYKEEIERCGGKVVAAIFYGKTVTRPPLLLIKAHVWGGCIVNKIKELTK